MWLINVRTFRLEEFLDDRTLPEAYITLSHRWTDDEVLFKDIQNGTAPQRSAYPKLRSFCETVMASGSDYAWCDTCCIDKSSSSELSESINSMFRWYQNSAETYVYLSDVTSTEVEATDADFRQSEWWHRGWCLQELLAPPHITFFNFDWKRLGTRHSLRSRIAEITQIPDTALTGNVDLTRFSISQRMSWAAKRAVTRVEDMAYCLLGLFQVNMPLLYGEGSRAFIRLQEEIIKHSNDHTIFVHSPMTSSTTLQLLAPSPAHFVDSHDVFSSESNPNKQPFHMTNIGLSIELTLYPWALDTYVGVLDCHERDLLGDNIVLFLSLPSLRENRAGAAPINCAIRTRVDGKAWTTLSQIPKLPSIRKQLYIQQTLSRNMYIPLRRYGFMIRELTLTNRWKRNEQLWTVSWGRWDHKKRLLEMPDGTYGTVGIAVWENDPGGERAYETVVRFGFTLDFQPIIQFNGSMDIWRDYRVKDSVVSLSGRDSFAGGSADFRAQSTDSQARSVLSITRWMNEPENEDAGRLTFEARDRNTAIKEQRKWGHVPGDRESAITGSMQISCQKETIDGAEIWVVDLTWRQGIWDLPKPSSLAMPDLVCDGCKSYTIKHVAWCKSCPEFVLCSECLDLAKILHAPDHEFHSKSFPQMVMRISPEEASSADKE